MMMVHITHFILAEGNHFGREGTSRLCCQGRAHLECRLFFLDTQTHTHTHTKLQAYLLRLSDTKK